MVVDPSALAAVLFGEPRGVDVAARLAEGDAVLGAPSRVEIGMVIEARGGSDGVRQLDSLLRAAKIDTVAFEPHHADMALEAFRRFGKGRHRAALNFGDCMSYAIARSMNAPLLFVGDDFTHTDIVGVL